MEFAISVVTNELVTRFISFPTNRYSCHACSDEKRLQRLQRLLLRVHTVVEEADGRYITNSGMLVQLKMLTDAMYRGYWAMGAFNYGSLKETLMADEEEEEMILSFLLQDSPTAATPAVLPIISGLAVGKKTLVAHVCKDERVCSHFSSIMRLNETDFYTIADRGSAMSGTGRILIVIEIDSDVDEKDWTAFYSYVASMDGRSKVIILSRLKKMEKFSQCPDI
ncbi:hypothetical protein VPH35_070523 [Triticum aestivum]